MANKKNQYPQPENFKPTREQELKIMEELAVFLENTKVLTSKIYPDLQVRGKIKSN